ncbi:ImmA/IrrE family metallo-endopeptidase [Radiobacillus deserti]|uniref:ImmA/IrrE family metallo-endopeptidase n=1 Tax=Radiobacillus deserti TaxID=2594883 RepID=A0A516KHG3_9BACI|nr:ImmA/IrrE family metallo-endopeptidase [Radiobacillus deserti]QDP40796.1 ImmA/IrrE family metallo-endopeptidase [Radiobacillus deserti]
MNFITYPTTALEDWVTNFYIRLGITSPKQIDETVIARKLNIFLHRKERTPFYEICGRYKGITIDIRESREKQREDFFHELCHILRHSGIQTMMPEAFRQLQEWDANNFTMYAAIPYHMIINYDLTDKYIVNEVKDDFRVTKELCYKRLENLSRKSIL